MAGGIGLPEWLVFLENRLDASTKQMDLLIALAGLVPSSGFASLLPLLGAWWLFIPFAAGVSVALVLVARYLTRVIRRRRHLILLMEAILAGIVHTPYDAAVAYARLAYS